jgi:hypothetical protein
MGEITSQIPWQDLVAKKRRECSQKIPREWILSAEQLSAPPHLLEYDLPRRCGLLSDYELDLTENFTAKQLLAKLGSGNVSSLDVTRAFCKRAAIAQQVVCSLHFWVLRVEANRGRHRASLRRTSIRLLRELDILMTTSSGKGNQLALFMGCRSV